MIGSCSTGANHSACLSTQGTVHTFGKNDEGQLGLGNNQTSNIPQIVPNLLNIRYLSCGAYFTVCLDDSGCLWSFGKNDYGQLGIGTTSNENSPRKVKDIPPIAFVSCGKYHTLCISQKKELWTFGHNDCSQLCIEKLGKFESSPKQTKYKDIISVSGGFDFSIFQTNEGLFACGYNGDGQLGIGSKTRQYPPKLIPKLQSSISQFSCGFRHSLFLDENGVVYGTGTSSAFGCKSDLTSLTKINDLPKIIFISTFGNCSLFLDENRCCWTLGDNDYGQLGDGTKGKISVPKKIKNLADIANISSGVDSSHLIIKEKSGQILSCGLNENGQLGIGNYDSKLKLTKLGSKYSGILKPNFYYFNSLSKIMNWNEQEKIQMINVESQISQETIKMKETNFEIQNQAKPNNSFESWKQVNETLKKYSIDAKTNLNIKKTEKKQIKNHINDLELELASLKQKIKEIEIKIPNEKKKLAEMENALRDFSMDYDHLVDMQKNSFLFSENENKMELELEKLFLQKSIDQFDIHESCLALWEMDLTHCQSIFKDNEIDFNYLCMLNNIDSVNLLKDVGLTQKDICCLLFFMDYFKNVGKTKPREINGKIECAVCDHNTPEKTIFLLQEYEIPFGKQIETGKWTAPMLLYAELPVFDVAFLSPESKVIAKKLTEWKQIHQLHLQQLKTKDKDKNAI